MYYVSSYLNDAHFRPPKAVRPNEPSGWWGILGQLRRRDRLPKEVNENLDGLTAANDKAGARAGRSVRRSGNIAVALPPPWLFGWSRHGHFPLCSM